MIRDHFNPEMYFRVKLRERKGLPIYESFPEFEVDNWSEETRAKGKTKRANTYLYDSCKKCNGGMYSDRMWQWESDKMERACKLMSGGWHNSTPESVNLMLNEYLGKQVELTQLITMQNAGGFDLYYVAYFDKSIVKPINPLLAMTIPTDDAAILPKALNEAAHLSDYDPRKAHRVLAEAVENLLLPLPRAICCECDARSTNECSCE